MRTKQGGPLPAWGQEQNQAVYLHRLSTPGTVRINIYCLSLPRCAISSWQCELTKTAGSSGWGSAPLVDSSCWFCSTGRSILPEMLLKGKTWGFCGCHQLCHLPDSELYKNLHKSEVWCEDWKFLSTVSQIQTHTRVKQPNSWSRRSLGILCFANMFTRAATLF